MPTLKLEAADGTPSRYVFDCDVWSKTKFANLCDQVVNFLRNMAETVDFKAITHKAKGDTVLKPQYASNFDPIRRKMEVAVAE